jgi:Flp pilus assembly protein TadD
LLQKAVDAHRRGAPDEAERLYRAVLHRRPQDEIVLNDLGVLMMQRGLKELAEELICKAATAKSEYAEAQANLGTILREKPASPSRVYGSIRAPWRIRPTYPCGS